MNFEATYGPAGKGLIHVHHLKTLASIGAEYEIDPVADLRPVCPNCHAMIHHGEPMHSIEDVRAIRDDIDARVQRLLEELGITAAA